MHRLFLGQNVRIEIAAALREDGHEAVHASEVNLERRDDATVFRWAAGKSSTLVTFDVDFAERAYWNREPHAGVVRLRLEPQTPDHVLPILRRFLKTYSPDEITNALVILTEKKVRIRRW